MSTNKTKSTYKIVAADENTPWCACHFEFVQVGLYTEFGFQLGELFCLGGTQFDIGWTRHNYNKVNFCVLDYIILCSVHY